MAANILSYDHEDEDYIDMEVSSHNNFFCHPLNSPPHPREFEFQMFSRSSERETASPADELFYKGKLLPLHIPPRLQMVEKLLQKPNSYDKKTTYDESFSTPLATIITTTPTINTPFESCNISPSESCQISRELNPDEYFFEYSTETSGFIADSDNPKKSWITKLRLINQSSLGSKLKGSRAYLKSLFSNKYGCSGESSASVSRNIDRGSVPMAKECVNNCAGKKIPFGQIQKEKYQMSTTIKRSVNKEKVTKDGGGRHRRSFSGSIKRISTTKSSSSSFSSVSSSSSSSSNSNGYHELQFPNSSSSLSSEIENSIQSAIAHCKRSHQQVHSRNVSDVVFCSLSASRIICEDQERHGLCRC